MALERLTKMIEPRPYNKSFEHDQPAATIGSGPKPSERYQLREDGLERTANAGLAQSVAALPLHGRGRGFEPLSPHDPYREIPLTRGRVAVDGRSYYTATFPSPQQAAHARDELALALHGEFAVLNFPQPQPSPTSPA